MTREEYMKRLSDMQTDISAQPQDSNLIDRQAAITQIRNLYPDMPRVDVFNAKRKWQEEYKAYIECEDAIQELPSVSQPKTGHWIWQTEDKYQCSCCGEVIRVKEIMNEPQYIACPMCDAKMEVSEC